MRGGDKGGADGAPHANLGRRCRSRRIATGMALQSRREWLASRGMRLRRCRARWRTLGGLELVCCLTCRGTPRASASGGSVALVASISACVGKAPHVLIASAMLKPTSVRLRMTCVACTRCCPISSSLRGTKTGKGREWRGWTRPGPLLLPLFACSLPVVTSKNNDEGPTSSRETCPTSTVRRNINARC